VLSVGDQLRTLNGWVEVRDDFGLVVRLGPSSELVYALDPQGGNIAHPFEQLSLISSVKCTSFATTFDPRGSGLREIPHVLLALSVKHACSKS